MTLTTDAGAANADSYVSLADADTYHTSHNAGQWTGEDTAKEAALRRATMWIDGRYRSRFPGSRSNGRSQSLEWPRKNAYDTAGDLIGGTEIPNEVVQAVCEAALRELASAGSLSPDIVEAQTVQSESVGPISTTYAAKSGVDAQRPVLTVVDDLLAPVLSRRGGTKTLVRS